MNRKIIFLLAALGLSMAALQAQSDSLKYGHMNLGNLLDEMPETAGAEAQLKVFADSLNRIDSVMTMTFQQAYIQLKKEYDEGGLTQIQVQQRQVELEKQRQEIQTFEEKAQASLETHRGELLSPILKKVDTAIKEVAKENGFSMIFDVSSGAMLFASETIDVTPMVKKKLGM
ncbi:MAG: OmpH family outer membrane protein [Bacteroidetes bacterium]|nr:MAG: OmpH family outer membrane protein [Bacteroidota bacterium]